MNRRREALSVEFLLLSAASLFLELALIRYVSAEIRIFAYFSNLVLVTCFLGLGLGYAVDRPRLSVGWSALFAGAVVLICQPWFGEVVPFRQIPQFLNFGDLNTWTQMSREAPRIAFGVALLLAALALVACAFVPLGQALGRTFDESPSRPLWLYSANVAASLAGVLAFQGITIARLPPSVWFSIGVGLLLPSLRREPRFLAASLAAMAACVCMTLPPNNEGQRTFWSPYQKLQLLPRMHVQPVAGGEPEFTPYFSLMVNSTVYKHVLDFRPETMDARPATFPVERRPFFYYEVPYRFAPKPKNVLVVGSGMGNDVAAALRNGAEHVDAVEIDPTILAIGRVMHPENPYGDPRVRVVVDDARAFFHRTDRHYDLIVFGLLDSHLLNSNFSNTPLDSYVYTLERFVSARSLLAADGILSVSFQISHLFLAKRLRETLTRVFERAPLVLSYQPTALVQGTGGTIFISGSERKIAEALDRWPPLADHRMALDLFEGPPVEIATDDWPYMYVERRAIPALWKIVSAVALFGAALSLAPIGLRARGFDACCFSLGFAFMLLETLTISRFALAYGATWRVSAAVISGILVMILFGNALVSRTRIRPNALLFAALAVTAIGGTWIPVDRLAAASTPLRAGFLLITVAPLFFAAIAFARAFATSADARAALLSNLLGAVAGGLAQCLSFITGQTALIYVIVAAYSAAWLLGAARWQRGSPVVRAPAGEGGPAD